MRVCVILLAATAAAFAADLELRGLLEAGKYRRAEAIATQRLKLKADDAEALYASALAQYRTGNVQKAIVFAEKASAIAPAEAEYHNLLAQAFGTQAQKASLLRQMTLARRCRKELEATLALDPRHFEANVILMVYLLKAPGILGGDKARARAIPDDIGKYDPSNGYLAKARLLREEDAKADLTEVYRRAVEANPRNYAALTSYASDLLDRGIKIEEVGKHARAAIEVAPDQHLGYALLARRYLLSGQFAEMDAALREGRKNCPANLQPLYVAASALLERGKELQRAEAYLKSYLAQEPEYGMPVHADAHRMLGLVLEKQGRKPEALAEMQKAVQLKANFEAAKKDLKRLRG